MMIVINCTTEEFHSLLKTFDNTIHCPFENNPNIKCSVDYEKYATGEEEMTCIPCLKKNIVWIIED